MTKYPTLYVSERQAWREWLSAHFDSEPEIWLVYPHKASGKPCILYNDAVEEALCFGWIDSKRRKLDAVHSIQRFTPRNPKSTFSQANRERLRWLLERGLVHPSVEAGAREVLRVPFRFPDDILQALREDAHAWGFFETTSPAYRRIRLAYIDTARRRPEEFEKRLKNFIEHCRRGKYVRGFGGMEKYY